jgi:hypothetical protein
LVVVGVVVGMVDPLVGTVGRVGLLGELPPPDVV